MNYRQNRALKNNLLLFFLLLALASCASHRPKTSPSAHEAPVYGPFPPATTPQTTEGAPPHPEMKPVERRHVALALGGAGVASFATVGLLKRFQEEGIVVDYIVTTGWPTLFCLADGFMTSVHDVEWFAMRLQEKDFYKVGFFESNKDYASQDKLSALIQNAFRQRDLGETKVPIIISAANTDLGDPEIYEKGDWKEPLLKTMSVPGIYRPYPKGKDSQWIQSLQGIDVDEAVRRGDKIVVAVQMYDDYMRAVAGTKKDSSDRVFRQLYLAQLKKSIRHEMKLAQITGQISLSRAPSDFSAKRAAIFAGYREGARLARLIRGE